MARARLTTGIAEHGARQFCCLDPEGHIWTFGTYQPGAALAGASLDR